MTAQAPENRVIEAELFILKDAKGNVRAKLGVDMDGEVRLRLLDLEGGIRAVLKVSEDGRTGLSLFGRGSEKADAVLQVASDGSGRLHLSDKKGNSVLLAVLEGQPLVAMADEHDEPIWWAPR